MAISEQVRSEQGPHTKGGHNLLLEEIVRQPTRAAVDFGYRRLAAVILETPINIVSERLRLILN
jgi:hypothetical protein